MSSFIFRVLLLNVYFCLSPQKISKEKQNQLIIWNVGQGQWVTYIKNTDCFHLDAGGEFFSKNRILRVCKNQKNYFYFSHADQDHINFYHRISRDLPETCLVTPQKSVLEKLQKTKAITICDLQKKLPIDKVYSPKQTSGFSPNELSHVFLIEKKFLNPGDSVTKSEKKWGLRKELSKVKLLILGHHGSNTSTSTFLLNHLPHLKMAISSSRKGRYGHPHGLVKFRLEQHKIALLSTELWGNIIINL